jgi:hypothetical protein
MINMGGWNYDIFIGRALTAEEEKQFLDAKKELANESKLTYYKEGAKDKEYLMLIDGMPVIVFNDNCTFYVFQHYIGEFGYEDPVVYPFDYTKFPKPFDDRFRLIIEPYI